MEILLIETKTVEVVFSSLYFINHKRDTVCILFALVSFIIVINLHLCRFS